MYYLKKKMEVAACHRLDLSYDSKCKNVHGHNWHICVYCCSEVLNKDGMVCDFKHIKDKIHDYLDHGVLNDLLPFNPTAENIAKWVAEQISSCYKVEVKESDGNSVVYTTDKTEEKEIQQREMQLVAFATWLKENKGIPSLQKDSASSLVNDFMNTLK